MDVVCLRLQSARRGSSAVTTAGASSHGCDVTDETTAAITATNSTAVCLTVSLSTALITSQHLVSFRHHIPCTAIVGPQRICRTCAMTLCLSLSVVQRLCELRGFRLCLGFLPHDAMLARYMLWACVHLCLSVTSRCSTTTDKLRIKQITPLDIPGNLVF